MFNLGLLLDMLTYCRPAGSETEREFVSRFLLPEMAVEGRRSEVDRHGNLHVWIGDSPILWSCHTDTVHFSYGRQTIKYDSDTGIIALSNRSRRGKKRSAKSTCLGADDTAGVFLMVSMLRQGIAGHYVFHYGEEIGGEGSSSLASLDPELIADARFAIALDRKGYSDVITHQGLRTCSDAFADSLASQLNQSGLEFRASDRGLFTDTANYTDIIGECTNLSVGYFDQHTNRETLDAHFVKALLSALCAIDPSALVEARKPGEIDHDARGWHRVTGGWHLSSAAQQIEWRACEYCAEFYDPDKSFASDYLRFCSLDCEEDDYRALAKRVGATYLDPIYSDVARALAAQITKARKG